MKEWLIEILKDLNLSKEMFTFFLSMLPVFELRLSIPVAMKVFQMPVVKAFLISWVGNIVPILPIIFLLEPIRKLLSKIKFIEKFFDWLYKRTIKKSKNVIKYGAIGLSLFVAIPLPITGAWTGSIAAIIFDIKPKYALPAIILGVTLAGIIVTILVLVVPHLFSRVITLFN